MGNCCDELVVQPTNYRVTRYYQVTLADLRHAIRKREQQGHVDDSSRVGKQISLIKREIPLATNFTYNRSAGVCTNVHGDNFYRTDTPLGTYLELLNITEQQRIRLNQRQYQLVHQIDPDLYWRFIINEYWE